MICNFFILIYFCFLINFFLICCLNIIIRLDNRLIFCVNSLFLLSFSFTGFYRLIKFKDNLRTIEPRFPKNLRTNEARSDFTGPYKKKSVHPSSFHFPSIHLEPSPYVQKLSMLCRNASTSAWNMTQLFSNRSSYSSRRRFL